MACPQEVSRLKQCKHLHEVDKNTKQWAGTAPIGLLGSDFRGNYQQVTGGSEPGHALEIMILNSSYYS